ncbi:hypothetical protein EVAR_43785_1 [Eumeta japonica]|uniref:Uncharacterized protein n=1 Tax=Eumeta variegata TaxID=151549 RepID=A0A4C1XX95_EUMVA|nr:hypothetical protein EVAR_43785_1 [Eumeta japonica]
MGDCKGGNKSLVLCVRGAGGVYCVGSAEAPKNRLATDAVKLYRNEIIKHLSHLLHHEIFLMSPQNGIFRSFRAYIDGPLRARLRVAAAAIITRSHGARPAATQYMITNTRTIFSRGARGGRSNSRTDSEIDGGREEVVLLSGRGAGRVMRRPARRFAAPD